MDITESWKMASRTLVENRLRSVLTMLGIIIGNWSVVVLVGIVQGVQTYTLNQLEAYGRNAFSVFPGTDEQSSIGTEEVSRLVLEDAIAIKTQASAVKEVAPQLSSGQSASYQGRSIQTTLTGTTPGLLYVRNISIARGRFFNTSEQVQNIPVAVLGSGLAQKLFGTTNPLGQSVVIKNLSFQVVGVMRSKGSLGGADQDNVAIIPITVMVTQIDGRQSPYGVPVDLIEVSAHDKSSIRAAVFQVTNLLMRRHGKQTTNIQTNKAFEDLISQVGSGLSLMLVAIASISLLVGGIGIMNIMLVSVAERTSEIGLRKAVGATRQDILQQFLIEAITLSTAGGLIGTLLGTGSLTLIALLTPLNPGIPLTAIILATSFSGGIGLFFGVIPAQRASRLDPIVALRSV